MPTFTYKAVREDGTSVADELTAATVADVRHALEARGYLVLDVRTKRTGLGGGASQKDFLIFNQEFMTLVKAGLPILQALEILHRRIEKPAYRSALGGIIEAVKGGAALSDAMAAHAAFFPPLFTATVRAGEQSGALVDVLNRFISYQKRMLAVRRKIITYSAATRKNHRRKDFMAAETTVGEAELAVERSVFQLLEGHAEGSERTLPKRARKPRLQTRANGRSRTARHGCKP